MKLSENTKMFMAAALFGGGPAIGMITGRLMVLYMPYPWMLLTDALLFVIFMAFVLWWL